MFRSKYWQASIPLIKTFIFTLLKNWWKIVKYSIDKHSIKTHKDSLVIQNITFSSWQRQWLGRFHTGWYALVQIKVVSPIRCRSSRFESSQQLNKFTPNFSDLLAMSLTDVHFLSTMFKTGKSVESRWVALVLQRFLWVTGDNHWNVSDPHRSSWVSSDVRNINDTFSPIFNVQSALILLSALNNAHVCELFLTY